MSLDAPAPLTSEQAVILVALGGIVFLLGFLIADTLSAIRDLAVQRRLRKRL